MEKHFLSKCTFFLNAGYHRATRLLKRVQTVNVHLLPHCLEKFNLLTKVRKLILLWISRKNACSSKLHYETRYHRKRDSAATESCLLLAKLFKVLE